MSFITWDRVSNKIFEAGIDRGVLYLGLDSRGIPWNGLSSIQEEFSDESESVLYLDGVKRSDISKPQDFKATITAYTYPDEFIEYQGLETLGASQIDVVSQNPKPFGLSYRTMIGNDLDGFTYGYRIHILYNLIAIMNEIDYETYSSQTNIVNFSWTLSGVPENVDGYHPTLHAIIDSRFVAPDLLAYLETILYGPDYELILPAEIYPETRTPTEGITVADQADYISDPDDTLLPALVAPYYGISPVASLPPLNDLVTVALNFNSTGVIPNPVTGLGTLVSGYGDLTPIKTDGIFYRLPTSRLVPGINDQFYTFED